MAKSLDELLRLKGVIASGEFSSDGKLIDFRGGVGSDCEYGVQ
jgi:roadblock/LC7 domain-containing protein